MVQWNVHGNSKTVRVLCPTRKFARAFIVCL
jgi:hypothetical protein